MGEDPEPWQDQLESRGILYISVAIPIGSTHPESYHTTIHAPWYVFEHWSRFFEIVAYIPDGSLSQDLVVLRRHEDDAPAPSVTHHRAQKHAAGATPPTPAPRPRDWLRHLLASRARDPHSPDLRAELESLHRELKMVRQGLYEQGRRISVLAVQLREEIEAARQPGNRNAD
jgi:hypothetical protein